jgi:hypothetical protein
MSAVGETMSDFLVVVGRKKEDEPRRCFNKQERVYERLTSLVTSQVRS